MLMDSFLDCPLGELLRAPHIVLIETARHKGAAWRFIADQSLIKQLVRRGILVEDQGEMYLADADEDCEEARTEVMRQPPRLQP
jgi:hypothetical protein